MRKRSGARPLRLARPLSSPASRPPPLESGDALVRHRRLRPAPALPPPADTANPFAPASPALSAAKRAEFRFPPSSKRMLHEVSLGRLLHDLETHSLVELERRIHPQDPQAQRQVGGAGFREEALDQTRPDAAPLVVGEDEDLQQLDMIGRSFDHVDADLHTFQLDDLGEAGRDVPGAAQPGVVIIPLAKGGQRVPAHRFAAHVAREFDILQRCRAKRYFGRCHASGPAEVHQRAILPLSPVDHERLQGTGHRGHLFATRPNCPCRRFTVSGVPRMRSSAPSPSARSSSTLQVAKTSPRTFCAVQGRKSSASTRSRWKKSAMVSRRRATSSSRRADITMHPGCCSRSSAARSPWTASSPARSILLKTSRRGTSFAPISVSTSSVTASCRSYPGSLASTT